MKYPDFTTADFVTDPFFQQWVLTSDEMADAFWQNWLQEHPDKRTEVHQAAQLIRGIHFKTELPSEQDFQQVWQEIVTHRTAGTYKVKRSSTPYHWYAAASLLLLGLLAFLWLRVPAHNPLLLSYRTAYGETKEVTLPDGSSVILGANSQLYHARYWDADQPRRVTLEGEAYFSVTHQPNDQPFVVQSEAIAIEVLGTRFNVNNRRDENQVLLTEGSIRLDVSDLKASSEEAPSIMMKPGEIVAIADEQITKKVVDPTSYVSWTQGVLLFEQATLREVIQVIEDHYGYRVTARGVALDDPVFTAELRTTDEAIILRYLSEVFNLNVTQHDQQITLTPRR